MFNIGDYMKRKETVSINLSEIQDCVKKIIYKKYPYLKEKDVINLEYASNTTFLLFNVVRNCDIDNLDRLSDEVLKEKGYTKDGIKGIRNGEIYVELKN